MKNRSFYRKVSLRTRWSLWIPSLLILSMAGCFLFPPAVKQQVLLAPLDEGSPIEGAQYTVQEDGTVSYEWSGMRVEVKPMTDDELNEMFPDESTKGKYSTNPYTYGNWIDPRLGYTPNRFTVFRVSIFNRTFPKVMIDPSEVILETDRGEFHRSYGISSSAVQNNFENYYRSRRGQSGNEFYRFELRMGTVRSNNYEEEQPVFKGENYGGFIVFNPVDPKTETVVLTIKEFVLQFGAFDRPEDVVDLRFEFDHSVERTVVEADALKAKAAEDLMISEDGPTRVLGNLPDDRTRSISAIRAVARQRLTALNRCFTDEFDKGEAREGRVEVSFTIEVGGAISDTRITESTVDNERVVECIQSDVQRWSFRPIDVASLRAARAQAAGPAGGGGADAIEGVQPGGGAVAAVQVRAIPVSVTYPFEFKVSAQ